MNPLNNHDEPWVLQSTVKLVVETLGVDATKVVDSARYAEDLGADRFP